MSTAVVEVRGLRKRYGDRTVVDGVDLDVDEGEIVGLLGANGAGKTTTVECLQGLRRADGGSLRVLGLDPARDGPRLRSLVGSQQQDSALPDRLRVAEAVELFRGPRSRAGRRAAGRLRPGRAPADRLRRAVRRPAAAAVPGAGPAQPAAAGGAGRADPGPGPGRPARRLGRDPGAAGRRHHGPAGDPLHGRGGGAVRPGRRDARRPGGGQRHAGTSWWTGTRRGRPSGSPRRAAGPDWAAVPGVREVRRDGDAVELHGDRTMVAHAGAELVWSGRVPTDLAVDMPDLETALVSLLTPGGSR